MTADAHQAEGSGEIFLAFAGTKRVAGGTLDQAAIGAKRALQRDARSVILVFNMTTGDVVDLDLRGDERDILTRYARPGDASSGAAAPRRGRPKLGVVAREVTLLPRHWEWLACQPGGASVALRKLVEAARGLDPKAVATRKRVQATYRFMSAIGGDLPGFEDASRALFAGDWDGLRRRIRNWPPDVRDQVLRDFIIEADEPGQRRAPDPDDQDPA